MYESIWIQYINHPLEALRMALRYIHVQKKDNKLMLSLLYYSYIYLLFLYIFIIIILYYLTTNSIYLLPSFASPILISFFGSNFGHFYTF